MGTEVENTQASQEELREVSEQKRIRLEKLEALVAEGQNPYEQVKFGCDSTSRQIRDGFDRLEGRQVSIAGRLLSKRGMGKASFADLLDGEGKIQLYFKRDNVGQEAYAAYKKLDIGDIIGVTGTVFRTHMGEISVDVSSYILLSKSLLPLPEKFHGLRDTDLRYRQRYVDLIVNPEVKDVFLKRSRILREIRAYLDSAGFLEVDTPVLHTLEIGAAARPFVTHHNTLDIDMFLRIETELYLKRLIVGGFSKVYEVGRIFRNEGMDTKHNPEFTTVELYQAYTDYMGIMDLVENLYKHLARTICGSDVIPYQGEQIRIGEDWARMTMVEAVRKYSGADYDAWESDEAARAEAARLHVEVEKSATFFWLAAPYCSTTVELRRSIFSANSSTAFFSSGERPASMGSGSTAGFFSSCAGGAGSGSSVSVGTAGTERSGSRVSAGAVCFSSMIVLFLSE